jgi:protein-disulfide isomerase-like protein with CxxC motif
MRRRRSNRRARSTTLWAFRCAFFKECRDISHFDVQREIAADLGIDAHAIEKYIHSGAAFAALVADYHLCAARSCRRSPKLPHSSRHQWRPIPTSTTIVDPLAAAAPAGFGGQRAKG